MSVRCIRCVLVVFPAAWKDEFCKLGSRFDIDSKLPFPRVYISDSTWLQRKTDIFRFMTHGTEAAFKGYKMVIPVLNIHLLSSSLKAFLKSRRLHGQMMAWWW